MLQKEWRTFLASEGPGYFEICVLEPELATHLRATTATVFIDRIYVKKVLSKHNVSVADLLSIQQTIPHTRTGASGNDSCSRARQSWVT